jgi:hypothetical protein
MRGLLIALMMEAVGTSDETSVSFYETKRRNIVEDSHLHTKNMFSQNNTTEIRTGYLPNRELNVLNIQGYIYVRGY